MGPQIYGLEASDLGDDAVPLEAVALIKCLDDQGNTHIALRATPGLPVWDIVGLLTVGLDTERERARMAFTEIDPDENDEQQ